MRSIDQLVDTLLQEMKIDAEPLPPRERDRWSEVVTVGRAQAAGALPPLLTSPLGGGRWLGYPPRVRRG